MNVYEELKQRELIFQTTSDSLEKTLDGRVTVYAGFDPTADSLHVGHLLPLITLMRFKRCLHTPVFLIGGATALIGDPSGKNSERALQDREAIFKNSNKIFNEVKKIFGEAFVYRNNIEWSEKVSVLDFFRDIGKCFSVNEMIKRDSVQKRLTEREYGISFTEFSYALLQANDYLELHRELGCSLQIGGSDQWGNIIAGIDLINKKESKRVDGITIPLLMNSNGQKFGKSEAGNVWLSADKTSPFDFYQFWIRTDDKDVIKFLKYFTFKTIEEIKDIELDFLTFPETRKAQIILAKEMTTMIHGQNCLDDILKCNEILYQNKNLDFHSGEIFCRLNIPKETFFLKDESFLLDILLKSNIFQSKTDIRRKVSENAVFLNNNKITNDMLSEKIDQKLFLANNFLVVRKGKRDCRIMQGV